MSNEPNETSRRDDADRLARVFAPPPEDAPPPAANPPVQPFAPPAQPFAPPAQPFAAPAHPFAPPAQPFAAPAHPFAPPAQPFAAPAQPFAPPPASEAYAWQPPAARTLGYPYPAPPGWQVAPGPREWSGLAITSLVTGILGFACCLFMVSAGFGIAALATIPKRNQRGRGMAIAGLVLSFVWFIVSAVYLAYLGNHPREYQPSPFPTATATAPETVTVWALRPGDCFDKLDDQPTTLRVRVARCAGPHYGEVFAIPRIPGDSGYPGDQQVKDAAKQACFAAVSNYLGSDRALPEQVRVGYYRPTAETWSTPAHRYATCMFEAENGNLTDSIRDTAPTSSATAVPRV